MRPTYPTWIFLFPVLACAKDAGDDTGATGSRPSIEAALILPDPVLETSTVTCEGEGWVDADGDPPLYEIEWFVDEESVSEEKNIDGLFFSKGDSISCSLTPLDSVGEGMAQASTVTVMNSLPYGESATIEPQDVSVNASLSVVVSGEHDDDQDAVTWSTEWFVNEESTQDGPQLSGNLLLRGDSVYATTLPNDGEEDGEALITPTITVGNALPTVVSVSIYPDPATETDLLSAIVSAYDADGDTVTSTYLWKVDGDEVWDGATLNGTEFFSSGQSVQLFVTPSDGIDTGKSVASEPVIIQ